jgi:hypothetical protein
MLDLDHVKGLHYKWNTHTTLSNFFVKVWPTTVLPIKIITRWGKTKTDISILSIYIFKLFFAYRIVYSTMNS